jgi:hypothetical protein
MGAGVVGAASVPVFPRIIALSVTDIHTIPGILRQEAEGRRSRSASGGRERSEPREHLTRRSRGTPKGRFTPSTSAPTLRVSTLRFGCLRYARPGGGSEIRTGTSHRVAVLESCRCRTHSLRGGESGGGSSSSGPSSPCQTKGNNPRSGSWMRRLIASPLRSPSARGSTVHRVHRRWSAPVSGARLKASAHENSWGLSIPTRMFIKPRALISRPLPGRHRFRRSPPLGR